MLYTVGHHIDLTYLNSAEQNEKRTAIDTMRALPSKLIPGTHVSFLKMAQGLLVMSVDEPPMVLSVGFA